MMINKKIIFLYFIGILCINSVCAQNSLWKGKGRIVISSDGNEHDDDDWAATPLSLAMLAAQGLQDKLVLYTFSDHIWGSNQEHPLKNGMTAYDQMRKSALGSKEWFGFDKTNFICAVDNAEVAYEAMKNEINKSTVDNPLIIVAAGPMQVVGEAIDRADKDALKNVTILSHSNWNNNHADKCDSKNPRIAKSHWWDIHEGWTWNEIKEKHGKAIKMIQILDQNNGKDYMGLFCPKENYDWIKTSDARNNSKYKKGSWDFLYERISSCIKKKGSCFDPSDAGMIIYLLTGVEKTNPTMAKEIMENPK